MDTSDNIKSLKTIILIVLFGVAAYFALPVMAKMAIDAVTVAISGVSLMALWIFLPAISEVLAQLSYRLWETAIQQDPITKLKRELRDHANGIANMEQRIAESNAQVMSLENLLREQRNVLSPEDIQEWTNQINTLKAAGVELINLRNQALKDHEAFEREVKKAEAQFKIGKAFKSALKAFSFNNQSGMDSDGARVALDQVHKQLAESQSKLNVILSRKSTAIPALTHQGAVVVPQVVTPSVVQTS